MAIRRVLVVGMHRSGTSAVAGWLHTHGVNMGDNMLESHNSNAKGHFENVDLIQFHKKIAKEAGIHDWKSADHNITWNAEQIANAKQLILNRDQKHVQWGWKDPRLCLFLDDWLSQLKSATIIVVYRNARDVALSLQKREIKNYLARFNITPSKNMTKVFQKMLFFRFTKYEELWSAYNKKILNGISEKEDVIYIAQEKMERDLENLYSILLGQGFKLYQQNEKFVDNSLFTQINKKQGTSETKSIYEQFENRRIAEISGL